MSAPTDTGEVPTPVVAAVLRGLSLDPEHRWPSLRALADALEEARSERPRRWPWIAAGCVGLVAVVAGLVLTEHPEPEQPCTSAEQTWHEVWNAERERAIEEAFDPERSEFRAESLARVRSGIEAYGQRWTAAYTEACRATRVEGVRSERLLDASMRCLESRAGHANSLLSEIRAVTEEGAAQALDAVLELPSPDVCADARFAAASVAPPEDEETAQAVQAAEGILADASALYDLGELAQARRRVEAAALEHPIAYGPYEARRVQLLGEIEITLAELDEAGTDLQAAYFRAREHGDSETALRAAGSLGRLEGVKRARRAAGELWVRLARVEARELGNNSEHLAFAENLAGMIAYTADDPKAALRNYTRALELARESCESCLRTLTYSENLAVAQSALGHKQLAFETLERVVAEKRTLLGGGHPDLAQVLENLAAAAAASGKNRQAIVLYEEALGILKPIFGPEHQRVAHALVQMSIGLLDAGRATEALAAAEEGYRVLRLVLGDDHPHAGVALNNLARVAANTGSEERAIELYQRAIAASESAAMLLEAAAVHNNLGQLLRRLGRLEESRHHLERAIAIHETEIGPRTPILAFSLTSLGRILQDQGDRGAAREAFERCLVIAEGGEVLAMPEASCRLGLAKLLIESEPRRARELAAEALALFETGESPTATKWIEACKEILEATGP